MRNRANSLIDGFDRRRAAHLAGFVLLVAVVGVFVATAVPQTVGADHSYVVLSDSMSPAIDAGAVVFVDGVPTDRIETGDVITYEQGGADGNRVTHRVVEVVERDGERQFRTKGDANEDPDPQPVPASRVIGVVGFHVPLIGYVTSFAQTRLGILALVVVPAVLLVVSEMWDLAAAMAVESGENEESTEPGGEAEP